MIKYIINRLNLFLISIILSSELLSLEILEVKMMDSYKITREFPGKLLPAPEMKRHQNAAGTPTGPAISRLI